MIKNFKELVTEIKSQVPIQELISEFIPVKRSGRGYVALCPFHDDRHPSLQIHPQKGIFKCFACGTGGDLITFYALMNKKKWSEVIPELALKYGLKIEYGEEDKTETKIKNQLYELNKTVLEFFKTNLFNSKESEALTYLKDSRKLTQEAIEKYEIGFAPNKWDNLLNYLTKEKKLQQELIITSGLFILKESQQGYYDRFRNRVIFPIYNESHKVVGFGGRTLSTSNEEAKYINSPETLIFNKGQILYGLNLAKDEIKKSDFAILTEGYLDVITAHQNGLLNTVATLGTALTAQQARLLTKYSESKKVYLCLDSDLAGKKAVESIFRLTQEITQNVYLDLRVITDLPAKDLDESLKIETVDNLREKIKNGQKLTHFIFDKLCKEYLSAANEFNKKTAFDQMIEITIEIKDPVEQKENIKYISHKLNIEEELVGLKIKEKIKFVNQRNKKTQSTQNDSSPETHTMHSVERFNHAEIELLSLYITSFPNSNEMRSELKQIDFIDEKNKLIKEFLDNIKTEDAINPEEIINQLIIEFNEYKHLMSTISSLALKIETEQDLITKNKEKILKEAKEWINWWIKNKQKMKTFTTMLKECKNKEEENEILSQMMELVKNPS